MGNVTHETVYVRMASNIMYVWLRINIAAIWSRIWNRFW